MTAILHPVTTTNDSNGNSLIQAIGFTAETSVPDDKGDKLNDLIDLVGELVIASASANLLASRSGQTALAEANSVISGLVERVRDTALQMRMVKISETFDRIVAASHGLASGQGKDIEVHRFGADTELDKSVVEKIREPLTKLIQFAVTHGIEPADDRIALRKPVAGQIELRAFHESGSIVIEVLDDGGGLNKEMIQAQAVEAGLMAHGDTLSDQDIFNLIFEDGIALGNIGAGLDGVESTLRDVRKEVHALRGTIEVHTTEGEGSRFSVRLPLTLAIIDGFLTGAGKSSYVIPLDMVVECIELAESTDEIDYLNLRGEVLPFVRLREIFQIPGVRPSRENVVVVQHGGQKAGIVVDTLLGEFQTVIKPLGVLFRHLGGISGSTILGSGEVAMILDVQELVSRTESLEEHRGDR